MPSAVDTLTFQNKKPKLSGALSSSTGIFGTGLAGGFGNTCYPPGNATPQPAEIVITTALITVTEINNALNCVAIGIFGTDGPDRTVTFRIRLDGLGGTLLGTVGPFSTGGGLQGAIEWILKTADINIPVSTTQIVLTLQTTGVGNLFVPGTQGLHPFVTDIVDTHEVKNTNIING